MSDFEEDLTETARVPFRAISIGDHVTTRDGVDGIVEEIQQDGKIRIRFAGTQSYGIYESYKLTVL